MKSKSFLAYIGEASVPLLFFSILLRFIIGILPLFYIFIYARFIDAVIALESNVISLIIPFVGFGLLNYFLRAIYTYIQRKLNLKVLFVLRQKVLDKNSKLSYDHIENPETYDLIMRVKRGIPNTILQGFFSYLSLIEMAIKVIAITIPIIIFAPITALIVVVCCIPVVLISLRTGKEDYEAFVAYQKTERRMMYFEDVLTERDYAQERVLFSFQDYFLKQWNDFFTKAAHIFLGVKRKTYTSVKISSLLVTLSFLVMIFFLTRSVLANEITLGYFTSISVQLLTISSSISWMLSSLVHTIMHSKVYIKDLNAFEVLSENDVNENDRSNEISEIKKVEFKDVSFAYPGTEKNVINNLSLVLNPEESTAIVGANGAGKTTLVKLLLGLYPNYTGEILINDIPLRQIQNKSKLFSVVFQDFARYEVSIRDNIIFGDASKMNDEQINDLMKSLSLFNDETRFANGLDSDIGYLTEKNTNISGGEWQKLILIRSLAHDGFYYILDEPTASLDPVVESAVYKDYMHLIKDKNKHSLIITHRLGAARLADRIVVLDDGQFVESGSHDELVSKDGLYKKMYETQKSWYVS